MKTITLARKPIIGTVAANVIEHGSGGLNIDASRIGNGEDRDIGGRSLIRTESSIGYGSGSAELSGVKRRRPTGGRFPANLILEHLEGCEQDGIKRVKGSFLNHECTDGNLYGKYASVRKRGHTDNDGKETVDNWICEDECPVKALDNQSGVLKSGAMDSIAKGGQHTTYGKMYERRVFNPASEGGASRFFKQVKS